MAEYEEEKLLEMFQKNRQGDPDARDELFSINLPLVHALVRRYNFQNVEYEDLFQEGCIGLLRALANFDPDRGTMFSSYSVPYILGEIRAFLRKSGHLLKVTRCYHEQYAHFKDCYKQLEQHLNRQPRIEEIANKMDTSKEEIAWLMELHSPPVQLEEDFNNQENMKEVDAHINEIDIRESINNLSSRERQIIVLRYFMEKSQEDTAKALGLSQSHISKLEKIVLKKLKEDE